MRLFSYKSGFPRLLRCGAGAAAALLIMLASCVRDGESSLENCEFPLRLKFSYTYNRENRDLLREEVPSISLYLYDTETGRLVKSTSIGIDALDSRGGFTWSAPAGRFSLVTWGGDKPRYSVSADGPIDSHTLSLPAGENGLIPQNRAHLWHNLTTDILINGDLTPSYNVDLHKISNDVTVTVSLADSGRHIAKGKRDPLPGNSISVTNNLYGFSGGIHPSASPAIYLPESSSPAPGKETHAYTILGISRYDDSRLNVAYGGNSIYDGPLAELIARQPDIIFDLDDDFHLDFEVAPGNDGSASVSISLNGWHIHDYNVILK